MARLLAGPRTARRDAVATPEPPDLVPTEPDDHLRRGSTSSEEPQGQRGTDPAATVLTLDPAGDPSVDPAEDPVVLRQPDDAPGRGPDEPAPTSASLPSRVGPGVALLRYPLLFTVVLLCVLIPSVLVAWRTPTTYTAEARLLVGRVDTDARSVPGYAQATEDLAAVYARVVPTDVVLTPVATATGTPIDAVSRSLSASPIAGSSMIRIEAKASSPDQARQLTQAASTALTAYVHGLNDAGDRGVAEAQAYQTAADEYADAQLQAETLQTQLDKTRSAVTAGLALPSAVDETAALVRAAKSSELQKKLRLDAAAEAYRSAVKSDGRRGELNVIADATDSGSNRTSTLEVGALTGLVAGILLGIGVVTARANLPRLRALRRRASAR